MLSWCGFKPKTTGARDSGNNLPKFEIQMIWSLKYTLIATAIVLHVRLKDTTHNNSLELINPVDVSWVNDNRCLF